jgi:hypothetical protein
VLNRSIRPETTGVVRVEYRGLTHPAAKKSIDKINIVFKTIFFTLYLGGKLFGKDFFCQNAPH